MIEFKRDKKTGELHVYKDGKLHGEIITMGDEVKNTETDDEREKKDERKIHKS